jgi:hypothetical protein
LLPQKANQEDTQAGRPLFALFLTVAAGALRVVGKFSKYNGLRCKSCRLSGPRLFGQSRFDTLMAALRQLSSGDPSERAQPARSGAASYYRSAEEPSSKLQADIGITHSQKSLSFAAKTKPIFRFWPTAAQAFRPVSALRTTGNLIIRWRLHEILLRKPAGEFLRLGLIGEAVRAKRLSTGLPGVRNGLKTRADK